MKRWESPDPKNAALSQAAPEPPAPDLIAAVEYLIHAARMVNDDDDMEALRELGNARLKVLALAGAEAAIGAPPDTSQYLTGEQATHMGFAVCPVCDQGLHCWNCGCISDARGTGTPAEPLREALADLDAANQRQEDGMQGAGRLVFAAMERVITAARAVLAGIAPSIPPTPKKD